MWPHGRVVGYLLIVTLFGEINEKINSFRKIYSRASVNEANQVGAFASVNVNLDVWEDEFRNANQNRFFN